MADAISKFWDGALGKAIIYLLMAAILATAGASINGMVADAVIDTQINQVIEEIGEIKVRITELKELQIAFATSTETAKQSVKDIIRIEADLKAHVNKDEHQ